jgi:hypothetical protein
MVPGGGLSERSGRGFGALRGARFAQSPVPWGVLTRTAERVVAVERSPAMALRAGAGWRRTGTVRAEWTAPDGGCVVVHRYIR